MMDAIERNVIGKPLNDSSNFKCIDALKELILSLPEINKTRVEFLKEELASGRYKILSEQIAAKMFADIEMA